MKKIEALIYQDGTFVVHKTFKNKNDAIAYADSHDVTLRYETNDETLYWNERKRTWETR